MAEETAQALVEMRATIATLVAANAARETQETALRAQADDLRQQLTAANRRADELRAEMNTARQLQVPQVPAVDGFQALLKTQLDLLNTDIAADDTWAAITAKDLKKKKCKDGKGDVITEINPLRVMNPHIIFCPTAVIALIAMDDKNCEQLHSKIEARYQFSHELVEEIGFLLLAISKVVNQLVPAKTPKEKFTACIELFTVLERRLAWLEMRWQEKNKTKDTPDPKRARSPIPLKGDHK